MDDADSIPAASGDPAPSPSDDRRREDASFRRTRERRRRKSAPAAVRRNRLLHVLFYDRAFRWFAVAGILLFGSVGIMWARIFRTTPEGLFPVVKVSGIDLLKARSLKESAMAADAAGETEAAIQGWISARGSNPGDLEANRGLLRTLGKQTKPELAWMPLAGGVAEWLLRLSGSNHQDFELAGRVHAAFGQWEWIIGNLGHTNAPRNEVTVPILLEALFEKGLFQQFAEEWRRNGERFGQDPRSKLFAAGWTAGWGPSADHLSAMATLETATQDPELRELALRMLMRVDYQRIDVASYERHFTQLRELGNDKVRHHVRFWNLLRLGGQRSRAVALAEGFGEAMTTVDEAAMYLDTLAALKLTRLIQDFAQERLPKFSAAPIVWVRTAEALMAVGEWDDLRGLAVAMRLSESFNVVLKNLSHFFEGVGEHHLGRKPRAEDAFDRLLEKPPDDVQISFGAAVMMSQLGYPEFATRLLRKLETKAGNSAQFWLQMQQAAYEAREVDSLIEASRRLYLMQATDPVIANNYASSLLLRGDRAGEAVKVTLEVLERSPNSVSARVNRVLALIQVGRIEDAGVLLDSLKGTRFEPKVAAIVGLAHFRYLNAKGAKAEALAAAAAIEQRYLFPQQAEELNATVTKLKGTP
jgi:Flp pilus assembly protein TadD